MYLYFLNLSKLTTSSNIHSLTKNGGKLVSEIKLLQASDWDKAVLIVNNLKEQNRFVVCAAVNICGKAGEWRKAIELFDFIEQPDLPLVHATLGALKKVDKSILNRFLIIF